jgi:hypothetical protein
MTVSTSDVFTLKGYSAQQESAAELWMLQQQLQAAVVAADPGPLRDAALAEMVQLSMLIEDQL